MTLYGDSHELSKVQFRHARDAIHIHAEQQLCSANSTEYSQGEFKQNLSG